MSFPEAVKQVLFGGGGPLGWVASTCPAPVAPARVAKRVRLFSYLVLLFLSFFSLLGSFKVCVLGFGAPILLRGAFFDLFRRANYWRAFDLSPCLSFVRRRGRRVYRRGSDWLPVGIGRRAGRRFEPERGDQTWRAVGELSPEKLSRVCNHLSWLI